MFFTDSIESSKVFYKLVDIRKFDNIVKLRTCLLALKIFLTSLPVHVFPHCFIILSEQSLTCTSITQDTPLRVLFIDQK